MKALKTILILLVVLVALALIASLILPKTMTITRSQTYDVSAAQLWSHVGSLKAQNAWSPWNEYDPNMERSFTGEDGTVGSKNEWNGNEKVGKGAQTVTAVDHERMTMSVDLEFFEPWESKADVIMSVAEDGDGKSTATWEFVQEQGIPTNLMMALMGMKGALSEDFDRGLDSLGKIIEKEGVKKEVEYEIKTELRTAGRYLIQKEVVKWDSMNSEMFGAKMGAALGAAIAAGMADTNRAPAAFYFTWDEENEEAEMSVGIPVGEGEAPEGFEIYTTPEGSAMVIDYYGAYDGMEGAHMALSSEVRSSEEVENNGAVMEEYVTDPAIDSDPAKVLTKIIHPVKAKGAPDEGGEPES